MPIPFDSKILLNLAVAMGVGLLIGAERERNKGTGPNRSSVGIRTFTIASLLGAVSSALSFWLLVTSVFCVMVFSAIGYFKQRDKDPGITTEIALIMTVILGGLAMTAPALSAALGVSVAILLVAKAPMHGFVLNMLTQEELTDFLILAAATLIILPLVPNAFIGPFDAINPRNLWVIVILVMAISAFGHLVLRWVGAHIGLPLVGLISGFISSIAAITAMGERAKETPSLLAAAVAGATLSSLATILQLVILLGAVHPPTLRMLVWPLAFGACSILLYGLLIAIKSLHQQPPALTKPTKTFSVKSALMLVVVIAVVLIISSALKAWFGQAGLVLASAIAGLVDAHAPTIAVASQAAAGKLVLENTALPILVAFSTNAIGKAIMAFISGSKSYAQQVVVGLMLQVVSVWLGWWLTL